MRLVSSASHCWKRAFREVMRVGMAPPYGGRRWIALRRISCGLAAAASRAYRVSMTELYSPVVSTQWLADHLGADDLVVVDATVLPFTQPNGKPGYLSGHESYLINGHLPGAVFADLDGRVLRP